MAAEAEKNFVHEDENWRQRVRYETESQKNFSSNWGFLQDETTTAAVKYDTRLVKYFNPSGGTWTVREKRVPERRPDLSATDEVQSEQTINSAIGASTSTHASIMNEMPDNVAFTPTSKSYGKRTSLEQFGISHYGRVKSRSTEPSN
mmetsp:Transcript_14020/g.16988  ORF Transcript_14020/g.16988 Transcript_14020/m.16988 type:complete len:147 (+) Transcript_14020:130-570(+)